MGFEKAKKQLLDCLYGGHIHHEARGEVNIKNLFAIGQVDNIDVSDIVRRAKGTGYTCSNHHSYANCIVHIIKTTYLGRNWYIKWYFLDPNAVIISVHN